MKFAVDTHDLLDALSTVTRALSARPAKQILEGVLIEAFDHEVMLTCTDGSLTIQSSIVADIEEQGRAVLPGKLFTEMVRKLPQGMVHIKLNDNNSALIRCAGARFTLSGMSAVEYPEQQGMEKGISFDIMQNLLKEMISHVVFAIAVDETRQILTGCLLEVTKQDVTMVALDGYRLSLLKRFQPVNLPENIDRFSAVIPGKVLNELSKILPEEETFCNLTFNANKIQVVFGNTVMTTVLLAGEYIDYRKILPTAFKTKATADRIAVQDALDRASLMAREGKNNTVRMSFSKDKLVITSNAEMGDVFEEMDCELVGEPLDIAFNAKYIMDVIHNIKDEKLHMSFNSNVSPCVFTPTSGEDYLYLILPVRVFQ